MKEKIGEVFSIAADNAPVPGCTISGELLHGRNPLTVFSLAKGTDISAEIHPYGMLVTVMEAPEVIRYEETEDSEGLQAKPGRNRSRGASGGEDSQVNLDIYGGNGTAKRLAPGESMLVPPDVLAGMRTESGVVYTQISIRRNDIMNEAVKAGEVFKLADLVPYQDGKIVNMDVAHNDTMKFAVMAFDAGTALPEHAAPGEAIVFALDGEGVVRYEGVDHPIKAGENFHFAKGGLHAVKADKRFKMALLLTLA